MRLLIGLLLILISKISFADAFSGNQLYEGLQEWKKSERSQSYSSYKVGLSFGYVLGLREMDAVQGNTWCIPENVTNGQVLDIILNSLEKYPQNRHKSAALLASLAIWEVYECPEKKTK